MQKIEINFYFGLSDAKIKKWFGFSVFFVYYFYMLCEKDIYSSVAKYKNDCFFQCWSGCVILFT